MLCFEPCSITISEPCASLYAEVHKEHMRHKRPVGSMGSLVIPIEYHVNARTVVLLIPCGHRQHKRTDATVYLEDFFYNCEFDRL